MANLKSSIKEIRKNKKHHIRNLNQKSKMKSLIKKAKAAIEQQSENKDSLIKEALRIIDKTIGKGIIKKQTGARKKSRLMVFFNQKAAQKPVEESSTKPATKTKSKTKAKAKSTTTRKKKTESK